MTLTGCDYKSMELDCLLLQIFSETLSECCFGVKADGMAALPFLVDALNSGSSLNSFAFRRSINPLTAIPKRNEVRTLLNDQKDKNLMM